ncbi:Uncharacterised protein [Burkholderia pseudomallei]|nr:Uncharacterised protein [Burkholderia pseudomallei]CAJ8617551.1 Uncharacterised protein [Burkholderia pseudomallei]CAJ9892335.1 Uncharacterised protein [Burkholderia pseudomallei]
MDSRGDSCEDLFFVHVLLAAFAAFLKVADGRDRRGLRLTDKPIDYRHGVRLDLLHSEPHQFVYAITHQQLR